LGNFFTINELMETRQFGSNMWHGSVLRLAMLMTHYRQPIDWTIDRLVEARATLRDWIDAAVGFEDVESNVDEVLGPLFDDLNFSETFSILHALHGRARGRVDRDASKKLNAALRFLGLWNGEPSSAIYSYGYSVQEGPTDADVLPLITARLEARKAKNWAESDRIRDQLVAVRIEIEDHKDGTTTWKVKR
jgi:cysteinyl-tRNA synthetase